MECYAFTLRVEGLDTDRYEDALYESGCDDAVVAVLDGGLFLDFALEAPNFETAVRSAAVKAGGRVVGIIRLQTFH
jgi:hypothetical protein